MLLQVRAVDKNFGPKEILKGVSLDIGSGEFFTILGESGSGKTTLLRLIAGFEKPSKGEIWMEGKRIDVLPPYQRAVNTVFQNYALFPHLTVAKNVAYGLEAKGHAPGEIPGLVVEFLTMVKMQDFAERLPGKLSGGQQQRVALARALVNKPKLLLLDEPLSALDANLRQAMQYEIKNLQKSLGITFIFVTHDQNEAMALSDRIVLLNEGRIEQIASPQEIYHRPKTIYTAKFIGQTNILDCRSAGGRASWHGLNWQHAGPAMKVSLRPERIQISTAATPPDWVRFVARVKNQTFEGGTRHLELTLEQGGELKARVPSPAHFSAATTAEFAFSPADLTEVQA